MSGLVFEPIRPQSYELASEWPNYLAEIPMRACKNLLPPLRQRRAPPPCAAAPFVPSLRPCRAPAAHRDKEMSGRSDRRKASASLSGHSPPRVRFAADKSSLPRRKVPISSLLTFFNGGGVKVLYIFDNFATQRASAGISPLIVRRRPSLARHHCYRCVVDNTTDGAPTIRR